jgi:ribonuclease HI
MKTKKKWYVVWQGALTGVFDTWDECKALVDGYAGARYKSFGSKAEALSAYAAGASAAVPKTAIAKQGKLAVKGPILWESISVDAACSGNPGKMEYRGVFTQTKEELFLIGPFAHGTNNVGEFLAIIHGLSYLQKHGKFDMPLYSDSRIAIAWVRKRQMKTELARIPKNLELWQLIDRAVLWMESNTWRNPILKWETEAWGEIPADFGRK